MTLGEHGQQVVEILSVAGVIGSRPAIGPPAGATLVHCRDGVAAPVQRRGKTADVRRARVAAKSVHENRDRAVPGPCQPVEIEKVAVGQVDDFAAVRDGAARPEQRRPHGLDVGVTAPPRGLEAAGS